MTPSCILRIMGGGFADHRPAANYGSKQESADYSSKQNNGKRVRLSFPPSLLLQRYLGMGDPHSLIAMYASAEKQTCDHDWY